MITFIIKGSKARTTPDFLLKDLPGTGGRMDIMCRCLTSSLLLSHGIREDVEVILSLNGSPDAPKCIRVVGSEVKFLSPDERSTSILIRKALSAYKVGMEVESTPGIYVSDESFASLVEKNKDRLVVLDEEGEYMDEIDMVDPCFVVGDHLGFSEEEETILNKSNVRLKLSPKILHASQCIVLSLNIIDRSRDRSDL